MSSFKPSDWRWRLFISLFVVINIAAVIFTNVDSGANSSSVNIFSPYAKIFRLSQRWNFFSPQPKHYVQIYFFEIVRQDGKVDRWQTPLPPNWNFSERLHAYNWQKFDANSNHMEDRALWQDIAAWGVRQFADEANPPLLIRLMRKYADIPTPNSKGDPLQYDGKNLDLGDQMIFTYSMAEGRIL